MVSAEALMGPLLECLRIPRNPALAGSSRRVLPVVGFDAPARQIEELGVPCPKLLSLRLPL